MKCIGYDVQFQLNIVKNFVIWIRFPPKKKGKGGKGQNKQTKTSRTPKGKPESKAVIGKKRKRLRRRMKPRLILTKMRSTRTTHPTRIGT